MEQNKQIRRLLVWNRIWLLLWVCVGIAWGTRTALSYIDAQFFSLSSERPRKSTEGLRFSAASDGPFVITHLIDVKSRSWAALPRSVAVTDSYGASFEIDDIKKLDWRGRHGEQVPFPEDNAAISVLFYRPLTARFRD
jgi:hypothetical protein